MSGERFRPVENCRKCCVSRDSNDIRFRDIPRASRFSDFSIVAEKNSKARIIFYSAPIYN